MKTDEIKEIKELLPSQFQNFVNLLEDHVDKGHFTAWSFGNSNYFVSCYQADEALPCGEDKEKIRNKNNGFHPEFDLASLTKPLFLNALLRIRWNRTFQHYVDENLLNFSWVQKKWAHEFCNFFQKYPHFTLDTFLSHRSNFDRWMWCKQSILNPKTTSVKRDLLYLILNRQSIKSESVYSDLDYMFLTLLMESLFKIKNWKSEIINLNKMQNTHFFHVSVNPEKSKFAIPSQPYIILPKNEKYLKTERNLAVVHDTNANTFATLPAHKRIVSGHAGFYGNINDVCRGVEFLKNTQPITDLKSQFIYGLRQKDNKFGHLGFTGVSFWFKLKNEEENSQEQSSNWLLLTNRTSRRKSLLKHESPKILIITDVRAHAHSYFFIYDKQYESVNQPTFLEKSKEYFFNTRKIWDDSIIFDYFDLNEVRTNLEKQIC